MIIRLQEIPEEGQSWRFNRQTGELNEVLRDLIGAREYQAEFHIQPVTPQGTYELRGLVKTDLDEQCSRCGLDFRLPVNQKFTYLLFPALGQPRDARFSKTNHFSDLQNDGPEVVEYGSEGFEVGDFFHEVVALSSPSIPAPEVNDKEECTVCGISVKNQSFSYEEEMEKKNQPFTSLKGIKFNS
jgi:uncharacterized protein